MRRIWLSTYDLWDNNFDIAKDTEYDLLYFVFVNHVNRYHGSVSIYIFYMSSDSCERWESLRLIEVGETEKC